MFQCCSSIYFLHYLLHSIFSTHPRGDTVYRACAALVFNKASCKLDLHFICDLPTYTMTVERGCHDHASMHM
jgi:hypothetical protein